MSPVLPSRRELLMRASCGFGAVALQAILMQAGVAALSKPARDTVTEQRPMFAPRVKRMIFIFMQGGPSHIDLFDPKPELNKLHLKTYTGDIKYDNAGEASSKLFGCPWRFRKYGQCGMDLSELVSNLLPR